MSSRSIRFLEAVILAVSLPALDSGALSDEQVSAPLPAKSVRRDAPFVAYWIMEAKNAKNGGYQRLLITHGPIEALAGHVRWSTLPLDNMAMTFTTYKKESLWDKPFTIVEKIGPVDADAHFVTVDNLLCEYEPCPLKDVIRLLERPMGTKPVHVRVDPLESAHQTAAAFRLLLQEQLKSANLSRPESDRLP